MAYVTVDVEVDLDDFNDAEIVDALEARGYNVSKNPLEESLYDEDLNVLIDLVTDAWSSSQPMWMQHRIREKLMRLRWGV